MREPCVVCHLSRGNKRLWSPDNFVYIYIYRWYFEVRLWRLLFELPPGGHGKSLLAPPENLLFLMLGGPCPLGLS